MGKFKITLEDGSQSIITTEEPQEPTVGTFGKVPVSEFEKGERNIVGDIIERPGAAIRAGVRAITPGGETPVEAFRRASIDPGTEETFLEQSQRSSVGQPPRNIQEFSRTFQSGLARDVGAAALDIATNPADLLLILSGQAPGIKQAISSIGKTKPAQAVGRFLTRPRNILDTLITKKGGRAVRKFKGEPKSPIKERISKQITDTRKERAEALRKSMTETERKIIKSANKIDDEVLKLSDDLQRSAETGSLEFQKRIPKAQRAASNEYGKRLDTISDDLVRRGETINKGDMNIVLNSTKEEIAGLQLPAGRAEAVIDNLIETKYGTTEFSKNFTLKEVLSDTKLIKGQTSSGVKLGTKPFSDDEVAIAIFNKKLWAIIRRKSS